METYTTICKIDRLPQGLSGKESTCNIEYARDAGSIPGTG